MLKELYRLNHENQTLAFVEEKKRQIREAAEEEEKAGYGGRLGDEWIAALRRLGTDWHKPHLTDAPYLIVVFEQVYGLRTNADGKAELEVRLPEAGLVNIQLRTQDARGNKIEAATDVWVSTADGGDYNTNYPAISVVPDKKLYRTGDTAEILINTDKPGATAMVAVEGESILEHRLVPLKTKSTLVRFKIFPGYEPNVFVTA